jgi:hypothetical protein
MNLGWWLALRSPPTLQRGREDARADRDPHAVAAF